MEFNFTPLSQGYNKWSRLKDGLKLSKYHIKLGDETAITLREAVRKYDPALIREDNGFYLQAETDLANKAIRLTPSHDGITFGEDKQKGGSGYFLAGTPTSMKALSLPFGVYRSVPGYDGVFQFEDFVPLGKVPVTAGEADFKVGDEVVWLKADGSQVEGVVRNMYKDTSRGVVIVRFKTPAGKMHEVKSTSLIIK